MTGLSRSTFLRGVSALAAAPVAATTSVRDALAAQRPAASLRDIDHIVVFVQENRSFDHYFGSLRGVRGFDDPRANEGSSGRSIFEQRDPENPDGFALPFHLDTLTTSAQQLGDLSHAWGAQHESWNGGKMDNWLPAHRKADREKGPLTMGYHTRADLPYYYALADAFTICEGYHCSVFGPTHPNRYFLMTGTNDPEGRFGGPVITNREQMYGWETYPERLERAGISWRIYHALDDYDINVIKFFGRFQSAPASSSLFENALRNRSFESVLADFRSGNIPQVSWICAPAAYTEHPYYMPAAGEHYTAQILAALMSNSAVWSRTAFFLTYDENDGQFDHVAPPVAPLGTPGEYIGGLPIGLGFRVPTIVVSPFSRGGYVCGDTFDHTSILRFIETRFGVEVPNLSRWRRDTCGDLTTAFGFGQPPDYTIPAFPQTAAAVQIAEHNAKTLPDPAVPRKQTMPRQEPGVRPRRGGAAA
ncbi:MAG: alkaline phosphatase family protein [Candidatus Velthaea sp.]